MNSLIDRIGRATVVVTILLSAAVLGAQGANAGAIVPNLSGTFGRGLPAGRCETPAASHPLGDRYVREMSLTQTRDYLTMRSNDFGGTRVIHIEAPRHVQPNGSIHLSGLGHWVDETLVVDTDMPATPLWAMAPPPPNVLALTERFELIGKGYLRYEASYRYRDEGVEEEAVSVVLARCEAGNR